MRLYLPSTNIKIILITLLVLLGAGSVIYNQYLVRQLLEQEKIAVELWAKALEFSSLPVHQQSSTKLMGAIRLLNQNDAVPDSVIKMIQEGEATRTSVDFVTDEIILKNARINKVPALVLTENDEVAGQTPGLDPEEITPEYIQDLKAINPPIEIRFGDENRMITQYVYYGESDTVRLLRIFPFLQIVLLGLLLGIGYTTYRSITRSEQSNLWVGMAKEAAHQLGTPISSLFGWIQLMKDQFSDNKEATKIAREIENDVERLQRVAERFGKIGSEPELQPTSIKPILEQIVNYMERRLPRIGKKVEVRRNLKADSVININPELFQWAIENMVKNSMDAIRNESVEAYVSISSWEKDRQLIIDIEDSGSGITASKQNDIFKPGYSTKKRGWGLGLSLTRRIIEDYHKGQVFVLRSEANKGTTMRIVLNLYEEQT
jgi:signal transduction histidine kinase